MDDLIASGTPSSTMPPVAEPPMPPLTGDVFPAVPPLMDPREAQRREFEYYMLRHVLHADWLAPITAPPSVLDVGCGTRGS